MNIQKHFNMKKLLFIPALLLLISCGGNQEQKTKESAGKKKSIVVKGSDTVLPLAQKEAEEFMKKDKEASVTIIGGGSGVGISALIDGTTDIGMSSRPLKADEKIKLSERNTDLVEVIIGYDALAVIVHPDNKVSKLTQEQISDIYTGKITNWKEVGGDDMKIIAYSRESSSGTYEFFKEHVMDNKNYASTVLNMPATGAIVQSVSQTKGAIGYVGLAYETTGIKHVEVSYDGGKTYYPPSFENVKNKTYPIARPLYFYYDKKNEEKVKPFIDFILSEEGQAITKEVGYVSI
jgi:phosphate transport system substrate-binding protein